MKTNFAAIETVLLPLATTDKTPYLMASMAWSFAMTLGQATVRLHRLGVSDDPTYGNMGEAQRAEMVLRLESQISEAATLLNWAARQASPDFIPSGDDVVSRIIEPGDVTPTFLEPADIQAEMAEFGCTEKEIRLSNTANAQRQVIENKRQAAVAVELAEYVKAAINNAISAHGETIDDIDQYTAIKMVDKIADKSATYAGNALNSARRAMRPRRRDKFNADYRLLKDAAERADDLLERLEHERDAAQSDEEPIQDTRSTEYEASSDKHHVEAA